jgi:hypothetical protein
MRATSPIERKNRDVFTFSEVELFIVVMIRNAIGRTASLPQVISQSDISACGWEGAPNELYPQETADLVRPRGLRHPGAVRSNLAPGLDACVSVYALGVLPTVCRITRLGDSKRL